MGLLEKAFLTTEGHISPQVLGRKGLLGIAEHLHSTDKGSDGQNDTSSEITNLCIDRLSRLADDGSTIDTALSVLKAFFPIISAMILILKDGKYIISNSVGSSALKEDISIQVQRFLVSAENSDHSDPFPASNFGLDYFPANSYAQSYPLHTRIKGIQKSILVLITDNDKAITQGSMDKVIHECIRKFLPKSDIKPIATEAMNVNINTSTQVVRACEFLGGKAQILVLELSENVTSVNDDSISPALSLLVGNSARFIRVEPSRFMIMLKDGIDRELYSHQLIKSALSNLNLEPGHIRLIHSSDVLNAGSIHELILTLKKGV